MVRVLPSSLRLANQRRLLERLLVVGAASRAELADATGMSRPTAGKIVDDLVAAEVVEEVETELEPGRIGRPGRRVVLESHVPRFILVEVGVHRTSVAVVALSGGSDHPWATSFATPRSENAFLSKLEAVISDLSVDGAWGFGLSLPGVVDETSGVSIYSPNLHFTQGINLPKGLSERLGIPGCVFQEIRALALGHLSALPGDNDFLQVDSDDGLGAAAVVRGRIFDGALPMAGELGHTHVLGNARRCGCGATGCIETLAARPGLLASYERAHESPSDWASATAKLAGKPAPRWLREAMAATGTVIGGALNVLGLARVVLTGAFAELPDDAIDQLRVAIAEGTLAARFAELQVRTAPRRRARGMLRGLVERLLIPTTDWSEPCVGDAG